MTEDQSLGCLLGGAVGDALGAPVEFTPAGRIAERFGRGGIRDFAPEYGRLGAITDDTQMTLFTAEGLLDALPETGCIDISMGWDAIRLAYLRWLRTQQGHSKPSTVQAAGAFNLVGRKELWSRRSPGRSCLSALELGGRGTTSNRINDSKGCGGVMRAAPIGLLARRIGDLNAVFALAAETAAITHGHPSGHLSAGAFAVIVAGLADAGALPEAVHSALICLSRWPGHEETSIALTGALEQAFQDEPSVGRVEALGGGWVGEEALAIGVYCALVSQNFRDGVVLAVNHSGDSDTTGSITGSLLGLMHGTSEIPPDWLGQLELGPVIEEVGMALCSANLRSGLGPTQF